MIAPYWLKMHLRAFPVDKISIILNYEVLLDPKALGQIAPKAPSQRQGPWNPIRLSSILLLANIGNFCEKNLRRMKVGLKLVGNSE